MDLPFNDTFYFISIVFLGVPTVYFLTKSGFHFQDEKQNVTISYLIAIALILLTLTCIFSIEETSIKIGRIFGDFIRFIIYMIFFLIVLSICMFVLLFIIADNKKDIIFKTRAVLKKYWHKYNDRKNNKMH